jgi:helicase MOV-10
MEPETLIPVAGLFTSDKDKGKLSGQLVLAGDPKQLGPVLRSPVAVKLGLSEYRDCVNFYVFIAQST